MQHLPTGTVTFLFTDIEGSTRLARTLGPSWPDVLEQHHRILRDAITDHGGVEVRTEGDAFFAVFPSAPDAVAATAAAQESLAGHTWPPDGPVRVRMGLHTGQGQLSAGDYFGLDVHQAARIAAAGHGGQVLLSQATRALIPASQGATLRDLGEHLLKDFDQPLRLFQLGDRAFPPLKTISNTNLPRPASSFIGRRREIGELVSLVREGTRMVTLTGPGGSGKSRLGLEVAADLVPHFPAGVFFVALAPVRRPDLVQQTVAQTLGATGDVANHIRDREMLLYLDNFEQVVDAAPGVARLLEACPNLSVLVTSRELLRVRAEVEYPVPPLVNEDAVDLFLARAAVAEPIDDIAELCARLDNLPLAVELAAARTRILTPRQIIERLSDRLDLLKGGRDADPRQATLRTTIDWSFDLLSEPERRLFARLAAFTGGCTLDSAESVCDADLDALQSLVEKSLLRHAGDRFFMLETILEFAAERLEESEEAEEIRRRHFDFFAALAKSANLTSDSEGPMRHDLVVPEGPNVRAAIAWARASGHIEDALRLAVSLENFWVTSNPFEGTRLFDGLLKEAKGVSDSLVAHALRALGSSQMMTGDLESSREAFQESFDLFDRLDDRDGIAALLLRLGYNAMGRGDGATARPLLEKGYEMSGEYGGERLRPQVLRVMGMLEYAEGNHDAGVAMLRESAEEAGRIGFVWWEAGTLAELAHVFLELGRTDDAESAARSMLVLARRMGDRANAVGGLSILASVAAAREAAHLAGWLWGAIEAEEAARGPIGATRPTASTSAGWEREREVHLAALQRVKGPEFDRGRQEGLGITLGEAIEGALQDR
ncbi:MAG TPA: adenylate/guanylate cyclase domain-containing protein [Actinomycetota bacterium]|nr:adenylate/guanylate cyclase domain-containing protein [Actinomycetota bacterium]